MVGLLRRIGNRDGLLVGDAAGAVSPLTAGGLDPCLRLSDHAALILDEALRTGRRESLDRYDAAPLRRQLRGRTALRTVLARTSSPRLVEAAFTGLRTTPGRAAARQILFSDRSFPIDAPTAPGEGEDVTPRQDRAVAACPGDARVTTPR